MKLTDHELERLSHLATQRTVLQLQGRLVEHDAQDLYQVIRGRLGFAGDFTIAPDGTITIPQPTE